MESTLNDCNCTVGFMGQLIISQKLKKLQDTTSQSEKNELEKDIEKLVKIRDTGDGSNHNETCPKYIAYLKK